MSELQAMSSLTSALQEAIGDALTDGRNLLLHLEALQRAGLGRTELQVLVEKRRSTNDASDAFSDDVEENCILALDLIQGGGSHSLDWSPGHTAAAQLSRVFSSGLDIRSALPSAMVANSLLPPRLDPDLPAELEDALTEAFSAKLLSATAVPSKADFFRAPKTSSSSRPAALLDPLDRAIYEALVRRLKKGLLTDVPEQVAWPRVSDTPEDAFPMFRGAPLKWNPKARVVLCVDIESFFENVDHAILASTLTRMTRDQSALFTSIEAFLDAVMGLRRGLPQGAPPSAVLATLYLRPVDDFMDQSGWLYSRYMDDYVIGASSLDDARHKILLFEAQLRPLGLNLQSAKTRLVPYAKYQTMLNGPTRRQRALQSGLNDFLIEPSQSTPVQEDELSFFTEESYNQAAALNRPEELSSNRASALAHAARSLLRREVVTAERQGFVADPSRSEAMLRRCIQAIMRSGSSLASQDITQCLSWFPSLAPNISRLLSGLAFQEDGWRSDFLSAIKVKFAGQDWILAWLISGLGNSPMLSQRMVGDMLVLAKDGSASPLARLAAAQVVSAHAALNATDWDEISTGQSEAIRAELHIMHLALGVSQPSRRLHEELES